MGEDCKEKCLLLVVALPAAAEPEPVLLNETDICPSCFELRPLKVDAFVGPLSAEPVGNGGGGGGGGVDVDAVGFSFITFNGIDEDVFGFFNIDFISTTDDDDDDVKELFRLEFGLLLGTSSEKMTLFLPVVGAVFVFEELDGILEYVGINDPSGVLILFGSFLLTVLSGFDFLGGRFGIDTEDGILDAVLVDLIGG